VCVGATVGCVLFISVILLRVVDWIVWSMAFANLKEVKKVVNMGEQCVKS
jgi:hypothetical protein